MKELGLSSVLQGCLLGFVNQVAMSLSIDGKSHHDFQITNFRFLNTSSCVWTVSVPHFGETTQAAASLIFQSSISVTLTSLFAITKS